MLPRRLQLELQPRSWGGRRPGAGRKPSGRPVGMPHEARPEHAPRHPVHVTLRACRELPSLRDEGVFRLLRRGLGRASGNRMRIVQFSVQADHVHLIVEAESRCALSRGVQGLSIRLARTVNRALGRRGKVWADRYHARALTTPREVRNAIVYVLQNWRKHRPEARGLDPCSSARWFAGFRGPVPTATGASPVAPPRTWLAAVGWKRLGSIGIEEGPALPRIRRVSRRGAALRYGSCDGNEAAVPDATFRQ